LHWKCYVITFLCIRKTSKTEFECDLGVRMWSFHSNYGYRWHKKCTWLLWKIVATRALMSAMSVTTILGAADVNSAVTTLYLWLQWSTLSLLFYSFVVVVVKAAIITSSTIHLASYSLLAATILFGASSSLHNERVLSQHVVCKVAGRSLCADQ
jgi:hypothetical protein